ncbi:restriction endonuclease subunit S [Desulfovibrio fairfieldensis]|uniref:restriction endonuclease subunit S n=1 Tax=Desulfovibrio fairfieldensis TaxID=44742 RepID=UPI0009F8CA5F|nr:restriction endonuclease subunit S [Desulfovibrio fairfieldensis]
MSNALQSGWRTYRFDKIAQSIAVRANPANVASDVYVGLEHLDPETIHLRRWGHPSDVSGDKLEFKKGDVIFGRRRAYQRKLAVADRDGICSAHAMVLRAKPEVILPELLPFFIQSDMFMERAISISVGSLSPTVNWKTLAAQEFFLPPIEEQERMAEILGAADEALERSLDIQLSIMEFKSVSLNELTSKSLISSNFQETRIGKIPSGWKVLCLGEVLSECQYGLSIPLHDRGQYPILRMMNYECGRITASDLKYVDLNETTFLEYKVYKDDILFNRTNSADLVGKVGIFKLDGDYVFASYLVRLKANTNIILPEYLNYYLNSSTGQRRILAYATPGVSQTNVSASNLKKVLVPVPPLMEQAQILERLLKIEKEVALVGDHLNRAKKLYFELLSLFLSGGDYV